MLQTEFQASKPSGSEEEIFFNIFLYTVELQYNAEFRVHNPETAIWSERDMYEY